MPLSTRPNISPKCSTTPTLSTSQWKESKKELSTTLLKSKSSTLLRPNPNTLFPNTRLQLFTRPLLFTRPQSFQFNLSNMPQSNMLLPCTTNPFTITSTNQPNQFTPFLKLQSNLSNQLDQFNLFNSLLNNQPKPDLLNRTLLLPNNLKAEDL